LGIRRNPLIDAFGIQAIEVKLTGSAATGDDEVLPDSCCLIFEEFASPVRSSSP
jgi:hypothetical protein